MVENTLFILGSFLVAWFLGRILDSLFERWLPGESGRNPVRTGYKPPMRKEPLEPVGASKTYRD